MKTDKIMQQLFVDLRQQAEQVYDPPEEPQGAYSCCNTTQALPGLRAIYPREEIEDTQKRTKLKSKLWDSLDDLIKTEVKIANLKTQQ